MKIARKYSEFLLYQLMESVMVTTTEFKDILNIIPDTDKIADVLWEIIKRGKDIKTNYNMIGVDPDKNDEISFIPDSQYQRFITKGDDISTKTKSKVAIGRLVRQILKDNGHEGFTDSDIEKFVNSFKAAWNKKHGITNRETKIVKGADILKWYNYENYKSGKGTLGSSCMRYPEVNNFMNLYAQNPEKVSMVVVIEEDRLIARALLWELSFCANDSVKYYLDRVYTESDSDQEYVHNWAVENVAKGNKSIIHSYYKKEYEEMIVKLDKVIFEKYPYADTMNYLYQKIEDGKLTGDGYVSNVSNHENDDITFVISEIRNHRSGLRSIISHRLSQKFGVYILYKDAIEMDDGDWASKSMCHHCEFKDMWILKKDAVYSTAMRDWIPKSEAFEDDKFGIILRGALINIATEYIGKYSDPIDIYQAMDNQADLFKIDKFVSNGDSIGYFQPEYRPGNVRYFSDDMRVVDIWEEPQLDVICLKVYKIDMDSSIAIRQLGEFDYLTRVKSGVAYMSKEDADMFNIKLHLNEVHYCSFVDIRATFEKRLNYQKLENFVRTSTADDDIKNNFIKSKTKIHEYLLGYSGNYRSNYNIYVKFDNISSEELFIEFSNSLSNLVLRMEDKAIKKSIIESFTDYGVDVTDEKMKVLFDMLRPLSALYILYRDTTDSKDQVKRWTEDNHRMFGLGDFRRRGDDEISCNAVLELLRRAFRSGITDIYTDYTDKMLSEFSAKYNVNPNTVWSYIRKSSISKIVISDFI